MLSRLSRLAGLRRSERLGHGAVLLGTPYVRNYGQLTVGKQLRLGSQPVQTHLVVHHGARLQIGDHVAIGYGCGVACHSQIAIGDRTRIGPFTMVLDYDYHVPGDPFARPVPLPIAIGRDVRIGSHVTILRGVTIGDGAVIEPGSVVAGEISPGERVQGVPARRVLPAGYERLAHDSLEARITRTAQQTFRLPSLPTLADGPEQLARWDSLGSLMLLLGLEQEFAVTLSQEAVAGVRRLSDLIPLLEHAQPTASS
ncbi:MAG: acyltransferase [Polyangiales bacterium]